MPTLRNASLLTLGQLGSYSCSFARNMRLARMLSKADFGLVSIFAMTITLLELTSRMSLGTQIIQSPHGEDEGFQSTFHSLLALIGLISAALIAACSIPLSIMFNVPSAAWAFALLGLVPLLKGFEHLDNYRQRRNFNFTPGILCELIPQIIVTAAAWPLAIWLKDYRAILWIILAKAGLTVLLTHLFAKRDYRWTLEREFVAAMITFSWPLLLNGLLIFLSQQADQFLIGSFISLEDVAVYAAAFSFAILPYFILAPVQSNLFLPTLSRLQGDPSAFQRSYQNLLENSTLIAVLALSPIVAAGEQIALICYGSKYQNTGEIVAILGIACAFRCFRNGPAVAAIAQADTINQLHTNMVRCSSVFFVLIAISFRTSLLVISICTLAAEIAATLYSIYRLKKRHTIPIKLSVKPLLLHSISMGAAATPAFLIDEISITQSIGSIICIIGLELILSKMLFPQTFDQVIELITKLIIKTP